MKLNKIVIASVAALGATVAFAAPSMSSLQAQLNALQNRVNAMSAAKGGNGGGMFVQTNSAVSYNMMNNQNGVGRELLLLNARKNGHLGQGVYFGGFADASAIYNRISDVASGTTFSAAATHAGNATGTATATSNSESASQITLPRVEMNVIADMNSWATGYFSLSDRDINTSTTGDTDYLQVNRAFVVLGNLNKLPVYGFIGRNTLDFGNFSTVNFNTVPLNRLEFQASGDEAGVGFDSYGLNVTVAGVNGYSTTTNPGTVTSSASAASNKFNTYTKNSDGVNNFTVNASYGMHTAGADWRVGAGYLDGSKRKSGTSNNESVGAWDLNGNVGFGAFDLLGEYTATDGKIQGQTSKLKAWDIGGSYHFPLMGKTTKVNLDYSKVTSNLSAKQWVIGLQQQTFKNVWMGLEYSNSKGLLGGSTGATVYQGGEVAFGAPTAESTANSTLLFDVQGAF